MASNSEWDLELFYVGSLRVIFSKTTLSQKKVRGFRAS